MQRLEDLPAYLLNMLTPRPPLLPHFGHFPLLDGQHLPGRLRRAPAPRPIIAAPERQ
ncbi:MAG: hypothetical protein OIN90_12620 [Candidatus Methanoperedens sp.]|nr:hypothetical protein [Candidatus Methanoperedens sp.]